MDNDLCCCQMGLEFRDSAYVLNAKNTHALHTGMVFNLIIAFADVVGDDGKKYASDQPLLLLPN